MNQMMKRLGIDVQEIADVQEVVIRTAREEIRFASPEVTVMTAQGQKTYQIVGKPSVSARETKLEISDEDVAMVAEQTGKTPEEARAALEETKGDLAEAIVKLQG
jgi:nascent polypeptide-associated complex subunit alpha